MTIPLDELPKQHKFNRNPKFSQNIGYEIERLLAKDCKRHCMDNRHLVN